jgi:putative tributyrin esterase
MVHARVDFFSDSLSLSTSMTVLLPQRTTTQIGMTGAAADGPPPVLYLLHGLSDDDTIWLRRTSIERYVAPLALAVVMPQVHRSFYTDEHYGGRYWTFLSEELPELVGSWFQVSQRREDIFVAGLSMGGYGALKWGLRQPDRFAAAATLSGAVDIGGLRTSRIRPEDPRMFDRILGEASPAGTDDDLFALLGRADPAALPALYVCCGE